MRIPRVYMPFDHVHEGFEIALSDSAHHHLSTVLRMKEGADIVIFNGAGVAWEAKITQLLKRKGRVKLCKAIAHNPESSLKIHLAQGVAKGDRMDLIMQKATELGVTDITPIITERGNVKLDAERWEKKVAHWQEIIINACEQSLRTTLPRLHAPIALSHWFAALPEGKRFILSPYAEQGLKEQSIEDNVTLLIGPEGGLTETEVDLATQRYGFESLRMGPRILRTETAAIAAITLMQYQFGDLS